MSDMFQWNTGIKTPEDLAREQREREWNEAFSPVPRAPQRGFIERVFSPVLAPQQTLFSFTRDVAEDGFQMKDLWNAVVHGAKYFNPFSDETSIDPDEVRQAVFGDQDGWGRVVTNAAIGLLFDPLIITGAMGATAKALGASERVLGAVRGVSRLANPAEIVADAAIQGARGLAPGVELGMKALLGEERATLWGTRIRQALIDPHAGLDEVVKQRVVDFQNSLYGWKEEAAGAVIASRQLGGREVQNVLSEALTDSQIYQALGGKAAPPGWSVNNAVTALGNKLDSMGVDRDLFVQVYERFRSLDDRIGKGLMETGLITPRQYKADLGTHLRRIYRAFETPDDYLKKILKLGALPESVTSVDAARLGDDLLKFTAGAKARGMNLGTSGKYLNQGQFDVVSFVKDFADWVDKSPHATFDDAMTMAQTMLPRGADPEMYAAVANYLSGSVTTIKPQNILREMIEQNSPTTWRTVAEHVEVINQRQHLPQVVRDALGEITEAGPRLLSQADETGKLLETRRFLDDLAGVRRLTEEQSDTLKRAFVLGPQNATGQKMISEVAEQLGMPAEELTGRMVHLMAAGHAPPGTQVGGKGSRWASLKRDDATGRIVQIPDSESYGELAGMWVSPALALVVKRLGGFDVAGEASKVVASKFGNYLTQGVSFFKAMKTVLDPVAQFRNFIGNAILMDMSGTSPLRFDLMYKAARELQTFSKTGNLGRYMQMAADADLGLFTHTFNRTELRDLGMKIADIAPREWDTVMQRVYQSILGTGQSAIDKAAQVFDFNEKWFKMTTFIDRVDRLERAAVRAGKTLTPELSRDIAKQAANIAQQALFNYADVPVLVDVARKYGIVPFITFPFKAVPFVAETLIKHPTRVLKYQRGLDVWNDAWSGGPEETARQIQGLPKYLRDALVMKLPFNDARGRPLFVDTSYFLPWGAIKDIVDTFKPSDPNHVPILGFREGMMSPPIMGLIDIFRNGTDSLGRPVTDRTRSPEQNFQAIASALWQFIAPPSAIGGQRANSVGRALQAFATNSPEPVDWLARLGRGLRANPVVSEETVLTSMGFFPQSQAQASGVRGAVSGLLFGGAVASDQGQAAYQRYNDVQNTVSDMYKDIARIQSNPNMSILEKNKRIQQIMRNLQSRLDE